MATLVLTGIGGAVAGPVGAALGALAGRQIDGAVLGRGRRNGPRLTELRIQASSYGVAIPQVFGTMRMAGTVIWSTDLIESRSVARAKGAPDVTQYSYRASFAVLLSARAIRGVGRIWADGNLLRGAAGDLKVAGRMRVHPGGEDQPPDPLIVAAEGAMAPANRGCAYLVFEDLALAAFGNRLPSLSVEVFADPGAVPVSAVMRALAVEVDGDGELLVDGFAATSGSVAETLALLADATGGWLAPQGGRLVLTHGDAAEVEVLHDAGVGPDGRRTRRTRSIAAATSVPATLTLSHYDPARDHQVGSQRAGRAGGSALSRTERIEMPVAVSAARAKAIAGDMLMRAQAERTRRTVMQGMDGLHLEPGAVVEVAGEPGRWRITAVTTQGWATEVTAVPLAGTAPVATADPGRVLGAPDQVAGRTVLHVAELPALDDQLLTQPRLIVAAAGEGAAWRGAALLLSLDGGANWTEAGRTAAPAIVGTVEMPAGAGDPSRVDRRNAIIVHLLRDDMDLNDADAGALDAAANLALVGEELMQFGRAEPLGGGRWRLSELWRGRRGTEDARPQRAGDRFVLLDPAAVRTLDLPASAIGTRVVAMASGIGDDAEPVMAAVEVTGRSVAPPAPVRLAAGRAADGAVTVRWVRRSRLGWRWINGVDAPLGEERERYRVTVHGASGSQDFETDRPTLLIPPEAVPVPPITLSVVQCGTIATSSPVTLVIDGQQGSNT